MYSRAEETQCPGPRGGCLLIHAVDPVGIDLSRAPRRPSGLYDRCLARSWHVTFVRRRMFPVVKVVARGLEPAAMYTLLLEFVQVDPHR